MPERAHFEKLAEDLMEQQFQRVPKMRELHAGEWTDRKYFTRHLVETVLRIRLDNEVGTYALHRVGSSDDRLAGLMAKYLAEEFGHEAMFARDLGQFGVSMEDLKSYSVFPATAKLMGYMHLLANREGPVPHTLWNWWAEWYQDRYNPIIVGKAADEFGTETMRGWLAHIDFDEQHDHDDMTWKTLVRAIEKWSTPEKAEMFMTHYIEMVGDYFNEVYQETLGSADLASATDGAKG